MSDNFAFLLPVMMLTLGCAFLIVGRSGPRPALFWAAAYLLCGTAFACPALLARCPDAVQAIVSDGLFAAGFLCFRQSLLVRFRRSPSWLLGVSLCVGGIVASVVSTLVFQSLRLELVASDVTCGVLVGSALMVLDNALRGTFAVVTTGAADFDSYLGSTYAFLTQTTAALFGLVFGLIALAALGLDVVSKYRMEALTDPLTGLWNRRGFEATAPDLAKETPPTGSVLTCDIDHFKRVNDTLGHATGDRVIATVARLLQTGLPPGAVLSRFGGEEFILYLPTPDGEVRLLADQLRRSIADHAWTDAGIDWALTASFGLAELDACDATLHDAIARADRSLYEAKLGGRNLVAGRALAA